MSKIYFIRENSDTSGGAEVYLSRFSKVLTDNEIEHQIVNSVFPKILPSWMRIILFNLQVCLTKRGKFYFSLERIKCPDVYRAGDGVHKVFMSVEKKSKLNLLHPVYLFLEKRCFHNAKYIIANSNMIKNEIIRTYNIDYNKIKVIYNGIELKEIDYISSYNRLSSEFKIDNSIPVILYVGSGFKRKGLEEFLTIISLVNSNFQAFVVGKDKNLSHYRKFAERLKIDHKVVFTGFRMDVEDFYVISDIFLFPTHYEPFSNAVLEAMSFQNVVFTTEQNGANEILDEEYRMSNPKDLSVVKKIDHLISQGKLMQDIKDKNRFTAEKFSIEFNMQKTLEIINKVKE